MRSWQISSQKILSTSDSPLGNHSQDFGGKNGAFQAEARELPKLVMTEAEAQESPFFTRKTTRKNTNYKEQP